MNILCTAMLALVLTAVVGRTEIVHYLPTPATPDSQCSNLTAAPDGTIHLTWSAPSTTPGERAFFLAMLSPGASAWSAPRVIVSTPLLMENWADVASLAVGTDGALTAQWFQRPDASAGGHGYDGWFSRSTDGGKTWCAPARLGHEFVALAPLSGGRTLAVWLESAHVRDPSAPYAPSMKLLARLLAPDGSSLGEWTVDPDVCTCCQNTVATLPGDRVFVGYRGHTTAEIRDNRYTFFDLASGSWSAPRTLNDDGWKIPGCPVNGPAADARGKALAVAWFTAANGIARVQARISDDAGHTLSPPLVIDLGKPMGRIETVILDEQSALLLWMETGTVENSAGIYARRLFTNGKISAAHLVADSTQARASGFPRAALRPNGRVAVSFTQAGTPNQVRILELDPAGLTRPRSVSFNASPRSNSTGATAAQPSPFSSAPATTALELCTTPVAPSPSHSAP